MRGIYSDENLIGIAEDIRENGPTFGRRDLLLFRVVQKDGYTLVAFMDNTVTDSSMHTLIRYVLIVGGTAIVAMFFISVFLSKLIILPLGENDQKQNDNIVLPAAAPVFLRYTRPSIRDRAYRPPFPGSCRPPRARAFPTRSASARQSNSQGFPAPGDCAA